MVVCFKVFEKISLDPSLVPAQHLLSLEVQIKQPQRVFECHK
jgi:hypothetical protein